MPQNQHHSKKASQPHTVCLHKTTHDGSKTEPSKLYAKFRRNYTKHFDGTSHIVSTVPLSTFCKAVQYRTETPIPNRLSHHDFCDLLLPCHILSLDDIDARLKGE